MSAGHDRPQWTCHHYADGWCLGGDSLSTRYLNWHEARFLGVPFDFISVKFLSPVIEPVEGESAGWLFAK
jgi:hypothetical protein